MVHQTCQVDICIVVFQLSVHFIGPYYLNCAISRNVKSLDFFCGIRTYSKKRHQPLSCERAGGIRKYLEISIDLRLGLFQIKTLTEFAPETIETELGQCLLS